jgi:hypothetical protein
LTYRASDSSPDQVILAGPLGDILAARAVARDILAASAAPLDELSLATLVLCGCLLHCAVQHAGEVRCPDLADYLRRLMEPEAGSDLLRSPVQFIRYVGVELRSLEIHKRRRLLSYLLGCLEGVTPSEGADSPQPMDSKSADPATSELWS